MNKRQKKKRYKKIYGHNPLKGLDGRYMFHVQYGIDMAAGQEKTGYYTKEQIEALKVYNLKPEDIERIADKIREAFYYGMVVISDFAAAISRAFAGLAKQNRKTVIKQVEEPTVVTARRLSERRSTRWQNGHRRTWRR